jgi:hypothetical protein
MGACITHGSANLLPDFLPAWAARGCCLLTEDTALVVLPSPSRLSSPDALLPGAAWMLLPALLVLGMRGPLLLHRFIGAGWLVARANTVAATCAVAALVSAAASAPARCSHALKGVAKVGRLSLVPGGRRGPETDARVRLGAEEEEGGLGGEEEGDMGTGSCFLSRPPDAAAATGDTC